MKSHLQGMVGQWLSRARRHSHQSFALIMTRWAEQPSAHTVTEKIQPLLRTEDTVIAVDERHLALLVADLRHVSDPLRIYNRLKDTLGDQVAGAGVALSASAPHSAAQMISDAQRASHSTGCRYSDPDLHQEAEERITLELSLKDALRDGQIRPHYQPIVELLSGQITGFEALARWHHPNRGCLLPKSFLQIADDCRLLTELDYSILSQSLAQLSRWSKSVPQPIRLSVNLCAEHFLQPGGMDRLQPILDAYREVVPNLRVDVSEQVLFQQAGLRTLQQLRDLKVGFHLDDFGVGPDSFHCLASFPFHSLKIDRSLIAEMEEEVNAELIAALLRIARRMKMRTIAEGLVTHAQLEELRLLGCNEAQGFLFSPAVTGEEALLLLQDGQCW